MYAARLAEHVEWNGSKHRLRSTDLIIATDSSHEPRTNTTGIGIFILDNNSIHCFSQPIGAQTNHFGELFAIHKSDFLIKYCKINVNNRRRVIFTDSLYNFVPLITTPHKINKLAHSNLFVNTQKYIKRSKSILWKVKSHTKPKQQPFNNVADKLAEIGRMHPNNSNYINAHYNSIQYAKYRAFHFANGITFDTINNLAGMFQQSVSMEPDLLPG